MLAGLPLSDPHSAAMEMSIPWAIFAVAAVVRAGSCSKGSFTPPATPLLEAGMDPMLHVLTVKAGSCVGCTAECVSAESFSFLGYLRESV